MFEPGDCFSGKMRCLAALAQWDELNNLCKEFWTPAEPAARLEMAPMVSFILMSHVMDIFPCLCLVLNVILGCKCCLEHGRMGPNGRICLSFG